uniref:acyl-CoA dehydrogenase family protein n=1 Tax=Streptomyces sp. SAT1 TaxID=1849967 RepID=UPI0007F9BB2F|nr:acyl-CoA dehydrogenase [Streptomyces sp. SAT1]ANO42121.1 acyl-CoA oxidase [Streptomyces sp. SAT1]
MDATAVAGRGTAAGPTAGRPHGTRVPLLTDVLFEGRFEELHRPWTDILGREVFRYRDGLSPEERTALAYRRLRILNEDIPSVEDLVTATDHLVSLHEWLGMVDGSLTTLATIHYNLFLGSLLRLDTRRTTDLSPFLRLHRYGTVLITELGYGNNAAALETTATHDPETDTFVLHTPSPGAQKFMPNTGPYGGPKSGLVAARLIVHGQDCGVFLFLVPLREQDGPLPGIRVRPLSQTPGSSVDHALTSFDRVVLPRTALLSGGHGELTADGTFRSTTGSRRRRFLRSIQRVTTGKLCLSAAALGGARAALTISVRHAHRRHTFAPASRSGVPLFAYRCHQTRLLGAVARAYAATFLLRETIRAAGAPQGSGPDDEADVLVAAAKGWITWQARDIALECRERCGAQGLLSANRVVDLLTPIESTITAEGDNLVIWTKAAADMLTGHGYDPPAEPAPHDPLDPPAEPARPAPHDTSAPHGPLESPAQLGPRAQLDPPAQLDPLDPLAPTELLDLLVHHELYRLRQARDSLGRPSTGALDRWNHAVNPGLGLVDAYAARRAAQAFLAAVGQVRDPAVRALLQQVFRLFALECLSPHAGVLLADGRLTAETVHGLEPAVDRLGAELAPHALDLVAAFAVPDAMLQAPIATDGYAAAYDDPAGPWRRTPPG